MSRHDTSQFAFRQLKPSIDQAYPHGQFVAIDGGQIVADAAQFAELTRKLAAAGRDRPNVLVVQAGIDYPETSILF